MYVTYVWIWVCRCVHTWSLEFTNVSCFPFLFFIALSEMGSLIKLQAFWFKRLASHQVPRVLLSLPPNTRIIGLCHNVRLFTRALRLQTKVPCLHNKHFIDKVIFQVPGIYYPLLYISRTVCLILCVWTGVLGTLRFDFQIHQNIAWPFKHITKDLTIMNELKRFQWK